MFKEDADVCALVPFLAWQADMGQLLGCLGLAKVLGC